MSVEQTRIVRSSWPAALDVLFPACRHQAFVDRIYQREMLVEHGPLERLGELGSAPDWADPRGLITDAPGEPLTAYMRFPNGVTRQLSLSRSDAVVAYENGMTVSIERADSLFPAVAMMARALRRELGYAATANNVALLLSADGDAVPMHFDGLDVLIVHLHGEKTWRIAPNTHRPHPLEAYFPTEPGGSGARDGHRRYASSVVEIDWPERVPSDARREILRPGSVAYVPRGFWHETHTSGPTVSLTFKLGGASALVNLLAELRKHLSTLERWRAPGGAVWSQDEARNEAGLHELREMRADLARQAAELPVDPAAGSLLRVAAGAAFSVQQTNERYRVDVRAGGVKKSLAVDVDVRPLAEALAHAPARFAEEDLIDFIPDRSVPAAKALVGWLREIGAVEAV